MKRILAMILTVCLLLSGVPFAMAAPAKTSAAAKALRLEATEGTVQMKNAAGRNLKLKGGTRLYNGYTLTTQKASYAYVSLDETKAVKLGASTKSEVFRSGKKLELKVSSGELFFNVKVPLKSDESLTIRTSTMVTSVRGTCGWVEVLDRHTTQVSLLEGKLDITSTDPLTGAFRTTTIVGGQTATIVYHGDERRTSGVIVEDLTIQDLIEADVIHDENIILTDTGLTVEELEEADVPGSVSVEVKKDKDLQDRIEDTTDLSVPEIIKDAEQRQEEEEQQAEAEDKKIQEAVDQMGAENTNPIFGEGEPETAPDSGTSEEVTPSDPVNPTVDLTNPTLAELNTALTTPGVTTVNATYDTDTVLTDAGLTGITVAAGQTLNITGAVYLTNNADITVDGTLNVDSEIENNGTITVNSRNSLHINANGALYNYGTLTIGGTAPGAMTVDGVLQNTGTLSVRAGSTLQVSDTGFCDTAADGTTGSFEIYGTAEINGVLYNGGQMTVPAGGTLTVNGIGFDNDAVGTLMPAKLTVSGTMNVGSSTTVSNIGIIVVNGTLNNRGDFSNIESLTINAGGILNSEGRFYNQELTISGTANMGDVIENEGTMTVSAGGKLTISGTLENNPEEEGSCAIIVDGDLVIKNGGSLVNDSFGSGISDLTVNGTITVEDGGLLDNHFTFTNAGVFVNNGTFVNGTSFANLGTTNSTGTINNDSGTFEVRDGTCTVKDIYIGYGSLIVDTTGTLILTGTLPQDHDPDAPMFNPTTFTVHGTMIVEAGCTQGQNPFGVVTYGTCINRSALTPVQIGVHLYGDGNYVHEPALGELYVMSLNNEGTTKEWIPASDLSWQADTTYLLYGGSAPAVSLPTLSVQNVTLDLNGVTATLADTFTVDGGSLTVRDSGTDGELTSTADYTVDILEGDFVLESGTISNTLHTAITGASGLTPTKPITITVNGGKVTGNQHGIFTFVPSATGTVPIQILVNGVDCTEGYGGGGFVTGGSGGIEHNYGGGGTI